MAINPTRIIIVEDHALTRIGLKSTLNDCEDFTVIAEAGTATEGLELLTQKQCDVAIVDLGLPDFDGIELLNRLRKSLTNQPMPKTLILTMHDQELQVLSAFAAGADSYCVKDTDLSLLIEAVRTTGEGHSWIDPAIASIVLQHMQREDNNDNRTINEVLIQGMDPEAAQVIEKFPLTKRELEILELIVEGQSNAVIAETLHLSLGTIKTHISNIFHKLSASDRTEAAVKALRSGLVH